MVTVVCLHIYVFCVLFSLLLPFGLSSDLLLLCSQLLPIIRCYTYCSVASLENTTQTLDLTKV